MLCNSAQSTAALAWLQAVSGTKSEASSTDLSWVMCRDCAITVGVHVGVGISASLTLPSLQYASSCHSRGHTVPSSTHEYSAAAISNPDQRRLPHSTTES